MRILALDTAGTSCSAALTDDRRILAQRTVAFGQSHNRHLMPLIDAVLAAGGLRLAEVDLLAVTRGPGSFTGVRIGLATVQALALAGGLPVVPVSSLEALALQAAPREGRVAVLLDARRAEVYQGIYRMAGGELQALAPEAVLAPEAAASRIALPCRLVGSGVRAYALRIAAVLGAGAGWGPPEAHLLQAATVARLARARADRAVAPEDLAPCYLRAALTRGPGVAKA
jgi:tRNA threonylcarbamoyladenosine biosynthesis protein TsaB